MKYARRMAAVTLVVILVLSLVGCGSDGLTGKWRSTSEKKTQLAFSSTGRVTMSADGIELAGQYSVSGDKLEMALNAPDGELYVIDAIYRVEDRKLYLQNEKGQIEVFVR